VTSPDGPFSHVDVYFSAEVTGKTTVQHALSILFKDAAKEVFLGLCTVFGTEMFRLAVETGYESFGVDRHLVGTAAEALDWTGGVRCECSAGTNTEYRAHACSS